MNDCREEYRESNDHTTLHYPPKNQKTIEIEMFGDFEIDVIR